jgi:hypothetical protein
MTDRRPIPALGRAAAELQERRKRAEEARKKLEGQQQPAKK